MIQTDDTNAPVDLSESVKNWLQAIVYDESSENQPVVIEERGSWLKIDKVPARLREVEANRGCYDPVVVAIGPYHHGKPELEFMQMHKITMARQFVKRDSNKLEQLYRTVSRSAKYARECYTCREAVDKFKDEEFIQMMLLDGCFILEFIDCIVNGKALKMKNKMIRLVRRDLFLLENQIPFQVLKILGGESVGHYMEMSYKLFIQIGSLIRPEESYQKPLTYCMPRFFGEENYNHIFSGERAHLLDVIRSCLVDESAWESKVKAKSKFSYWFSYRSAKELNAVGIHFTPSKTNKFTDVDFQRKFYCAGYLKLPKICIDYSTKSMLLNMVAHESSTNGPQGFGVSSYICFMDLLIDHAEDVKELRKRGILVNFLGSDQQVADLINEISDNLEADLSAYALVRDGIEEHYKSTWKVWLAECWHTHFSSPWTILAFIGAILALILSFIQTYKSIWPSNR